jgi:hypothetical protein
VWHHCIIFARHLAHFTLAKHKIQAIIGGGKHGVVKVSYLQLTWPSGWSARNFWHWFLGQKFNFTYMNSKGETQKPDSRIFGMCSPVDWGQLISKWDPVEGSYINYCNPQTLIFKMKLTHITAVLQTAPPMAFVACLKCLLSNYSEINAVTFILAKFSRVLRAHFPSRRNAFHYSFADSVLLSLGTSGYSHFIKIGITETTAPTECLKLYSFGRGTVFISHQTNTTFMLLYWSDNYWRQQFNK